MVRFVENPVTMRTVPLGMARRYNDRTGDMIARSARALAPVDRSPFRDPGPHLNTSIRSATRVTSATHVQTDVGSVLNHALVVHVGARPHLILPRSPGGKLNFYWDRVGRFVSLSSVNHPGMGGTPYLTAPLITIGTARGYIVVIAPRPV